MEIRISLAAARVNAGLTQEDVSKRLNVAKRTIVNWENGKSTPNVDHARKLVELYGIPFDNIFFPSDSTLSVESGAAEKTPAEPENAESGE